MRVVAVLFDVGAILTEGNIGADGTCSLFCFSFLLACWPYFRQFTDS